MLADAMLDKHLVVLACKIPVRIFPTVTKRLTTIQMTSAR
jgi:hypothetical protein